MASGLGGLNTRSVPLVNIDPTTGRPTDAAVTRALTAYPQLAPRPGFGPPQGTKGARGAYPDPMNSLGEPWPGNYDQTVAQNGRVDPASNYSPFKDPDAGITQAYADTIGTPGANQGTGPRMGNDAERAITQILIQGGNGQTGSGFTGGWGTRAPAPQMAWEPAVSSGPAPAGDPWGGMRISPATPQQGMVMGAAPRTSVAQSLHSSLLGRQNAAAARAALVGDSSTPQRSKTSIANVPAELRARYVQKLNSGGSQAARQFLANHTKK